MKLILLLVCIFSFDKAFAQQTYSKLNVNLLGLPSESTEKVLYTDATGKVRSSTVSKTTLDYLDVTSSIQDQLDVLSTGVLDNTNNLSDHLSDTTPHAVISSSSIESPTRLDPKKDTKANLVTYSSTAQNGELVFATDEKKQYQVIDGALKEIAGGGGSRLNLMIDGSFETDVLDGSCTGCTATQETSASHVLQTANNTKALKLAFSAATGCYTVDKTTVSSYENAQGAVSAHIKTSLPDITFTPRRNGADTLNIKSKR